MLKMLFCYSSILVILSFHYNPANGDLTKVDPELLSSLGKGVRENILVFFVDGVQPAIDKASALGYAGRDQRTQAFVNSLREHSAASQEGVVTILSRRRDRHNFKYFKQYWTGNKLFIKEANLETVLAVIGDEDVLKVKREPTGIIPATQTEEPVTRDAPDFWRYGLWGLNRTHVKEAWDELGGNKGDGVIVATIGTGVRHTHEALRDNFIGIEYGWYDATEEQLQKPADASGHGSHTMGTIVGSFGIGVAPEAKWMTCKACSDIHCPGEALLDCIQFLACPTHPDGSSEDCTKAAHIISNSWVLPRGADDFNEDILRWWAMGIIPIFTIGSNGVACNTTRAPGEHPLVIGVGGCNQLEEGLPDSSVGWSSNGHIKPDLVAPAGGIVSAHHQNDTWYYSETGTSMAAPHVAGVVALLKAQNPDLTYEEAYEFLTKNTDNTIELHSDWENKYCHEGPKDQFPLPVPNIFFGYGRVNALKAVQAQTQAMAAKEQ